MAKKQQVTWQISEEAIKAVRAKAKKEKKAIQVAADELIIKGAE